MRAPTASPDWPPIHPVMPVILDPNDRTAQPIQNNASDAAGDTRGDVAGDATGDATGDTSGDATADAAVRLLAGRKMLGPIALFVLSHRPLAFVAGQAILLVDPVAGLLGVPAWDRWAGPWAALLSHPDGPDRIVTALDRSPTPLASQESR